MTISSKVRSALLALLSIATVFQFGLASVTVHAQPSTDDPIKLLESTKLDSAPAGTAANRLPVIVGSMIKIAMGLLGIIVLVLIVYAGFIWMTAAGDDKKVASAKAILKNAVIGAIILFLAYSITAFVLSSVQRATQTP